MSSAERGEQNAKSEIEKKAEMELLFEVAERRFAEAVAAQQRNHDARFYTFVYIENTRFCLIKLASSYAEVTAVGKHNADVVDLLAPTLDSNTENTLVEPLTGNPEAFFLIRRSNPDGYSMAIVKTDRIDRFTEPEDADDTVVKTINTEDKVMSYVDILNRYDMIPAGVIPQTDPDDRYRIYS